MRQALLLLLLLAVPAAGAAADPARVEVKITDAGFEPREITARKGQPLAITFLRTTERTCIKAIDIPAERVKGFDLPLNKPVTLTITPQKAGVQAFHCTAMAMGNGRIVVKD